MVFSNIKIMDYITYSEKLENIKYFIESKICVNAVSLSLKLGIPKRTVLRMVEKLRQKGVDIIYCKKQKKYFINKK
jgi:Mn-dependent DtxR family transcriptional regulator